MEKDKMRLPWPEWQIKEQIGEGAFGAVYRVERREQDKLFEAAVKIISIPSRKSDMDEWSDYGISGEEYFWQLKEDISNEIAIMESLKSASNIVTIEDYKIEKNESGVGWILFIRMELLKNLKNYLSENEVSEEMVIKLGCDICRALDACRVKGIIHRDIKPGNIFISEFGDFKLGDFGISRQLEHTTAGVTRTGTVNYMAPEVFRGEKYGPTVDIYSLGLVLYQMANKMRMPFWPLTGIPRSKDMENAQSRRMQGECLPDPVMGSPRLLSVIRKACAYRPEERFQTPMEMYRALKSGMVQEEQTIKTFSPMPEQRREEDDWTTGTVLGPRRSQQAPPPKPPKPSPFRKVLIVLIAVCAIAAGISGGMIVAHYLGGSGLQTEHAESTAVENAQESTVVPTATPKPPVLIIEDGEVAEEAEPTPTPTQEPTATVTPQPTSTPAPQPTAAAILPESTIYEENDLVASSRIQEYKGRKYTSYNILREGWTCISGDYVDAMLVYKDHIYWRKTTELGHFQCQIIRMNLDCSEQQVLTSYADSYGAMFVYQDELYYTHLDDAGNRSSRKLDLNNPQNVTELPYYIRMGSEEKWYVYDDEAMYSADPGMTNVQYAYKVNRDELGVVGTKLYYMHEKDGVYETKYYDPVTETRETVVKSNSKCVVAGDALYYKEVNGNNTVLYREDLLSSTVKSYYLGEFNLYMGGGFYEFGDKAYFIQFQPQNGSANTEFWEMDLNTGVRTLVSTWYNSNAENAAKEP